jgi:hypothetical protein
MSIQQNVAQYLRELADKVERSSYCTISSTDNRVYTVGYIDRGIVEKLPTGERQVELKLNYIEENT